MGWEKTSRSHPTYGFCGAKDDLGDLPANATPFTRALVAVLDGHYDQVSLGPELEGPDEGGWWVCGLGPVFITADANFKQDRRNQGPWRRLYLP